MAGLAYRILGPVEMDRNGTRVPVDGRQRRTVLAALLLARGKLVTDSRLIAAVWGERPPATVNAQLFTHVSRLRGLMGGNGTVVRHDGGYSLRVESALLDLIQFEELTARAKTALAAGAVSAASGWLRDALALWRGPALAGVTEYLARSERPVLEEARLTALEEAIDADLVLARHGKLIPELTGLVTKYPLRERMRGQLMLALYRAGRQAEALEVYRAGRRFLVDELGLEPGAQLRQLEHAILNGDRVLRPPDPGARQAVAAGPSAERQPVPRLADDLYGRERELAELPHLVQDAQMVTLVGPPGVGKTRLAAEIALAVSDQYPDGVHLAELDSVTDPDLVAEAVAGALHVGGHGTVIDRLAEWMSARRALLILDNCEHVARACAQLVNEITRRCPRQAILTTSRQPLGYQRETVRPIGPLETPEQDDADTVRESAAGRLFLARAASAGSAFGLSEQNAATVARLCRALGGLPLAIELAAARLRALPVEQVADRIDHHLELLARPGAADARHESLRAAFDWSYELLTEQERLAFARMSVFAGGCSIDAAEAVIGDENLPPGQVLEVLCRLVDRSLVETEKRAGSARYRLLGALRAYAARHLEARDDGTGVLHRHALFFCELAEQAQRASRQPGGRLLLERLQVEFANLWVAVRAARDQGRHDLSLRLVAALRVYTGYPGEVEVLAWTRSALDAAPEGAAPDLIAGARVTAGSLAMCVAPAEACAHLVAALELAGARGDQPMILAARLELARAVWLSGDFPAARGHADLVIEAARACRDDFWLAQAFLLAGRMSGLDGDLDQAQELTEQALTLFTDRQDRAGIKEALVVRGQVACANGLIDEADQLIARAGREEGPLPATEVAPTSLALGWIACRRGHLDQAADHLARILTEGPDLRELPGLMAWITTPCLQLGAGIALARGDHRASAVLLAACRTLSAPAAMPPTARALQQALHDQVCSALDARALDSARGQGESMTVDDAVSYALAMCRATHAPLA